MGRNPPTRIDRDAIGKRIASRVAQMDAPGPSEVQGPQGACSSCGKADHTVVVSPAYGVPLCRDCSTSKVLNDPGMQQQSQAPGGEWDTGLDQATGETVSIHTPCGSSCSGGACENCGKPVPSSGGQVDETSHYRSSGKRYAGPNNSHVVVVSGPSIGSQVIGAFNEYMANEKAQELKQRRDQMGSTAQVSVSFRMSGSGRVPVMSDEEIGQLLRQASKTAQFAPKPMVCKDCGTSAGESTYDEEQCPKCGGVATPVCKDCKKAPSNNDGTGKCEQCSFSESRRDWRYDAGKKEAAQDVHFAVSFFKLGSNQPVSEIIAELAVSPQKRAIGLSKHEMLHPMAGMLFLSEKGPAPRTETYHVGGVKFPFDLLFIRRDQRIGKIVHNIQPQDKGHWTYDKTSAVIEVVGGYCKAHGIKAGDLVRIGVPKVAQSGDVYTTEIPGLHPRCGQILEYIGKYDRGQGAGVSYSDMEHIQPLLDQGLVQTSGQPERRGVMSLSLTDAGRQVLSGRNAQMGPPAGTCVDCEKSPATDECHNCGAGFCRGCWDNTSLTGHGQCPACGVKKQVQGPNYQAMLRKGGQTYCDGCGSLESLTAVFGDRQPTQMYWVCDKCAVMTGKKDEEGKTAQSHAIESKCPTCQCLRLFVPQGSSWVCKKCGTPEPSLEGFQGGPSAYPPMEQESADHGQTKNPWPEDRTPKYPRDRTDFTPGKGGCPQCGSTALDPEVGMCLECGYDDESKQAAPMAPIQDVPSAEPEESGGKQPHSTWKKPKQGQGMSSPDSMPPCQACQRWEADMQSPDGRWLCSECIGDMGDYGNEQQQEKEGFGNSVDPLRSITEADKKSLLISI